MATTTINLQLLNLLILQTLLSVAEELSLAYIGCQGCVECALLQWVP